VIDFPTINVAQALKHPAGDFPCNYMKEEPLFRLERYNALGWKVLCGVNWCTSIVGGLEM
jgi:hypothetical protein